MSEDLLLISDFRDIYCKQSYRWSVVFVATNLWLVFTIKLHQSFSITRISFESSNIVNKLSRDTINKYLQFVCWVRPKIRKKYLKNIIF